MPVLGVELVDRADQRRHRGFPEIDQLGVLARGNKASRQLDGNKRNAQQHFVEVERQEDHVGVIDGFDFGSDQYGLGDHVERIADGAGLGSGSEVSGAAVGEAAVTARGG